MEIGTLVKVYQDPITQKEYEGIGRVVEIYNGPGGQAGGCYVDVVFQCDEPEGPECYRLVFESDIVSSQEARHTESLGTWKLKGEATKIKEATTLILSSRGFHIMAVGMATAVHNSRKKKHPAFSDIEDMEKLGHAFGGPLFEHYKEVLALEELGLFKGLQVFYKNSLMEEGEVIEVTGHTLGNLVRGKRVSDEAEFLMGPGDIVNPAAELDVKPSGRRSTNPDITYKSTVSVYLEGKRVGEIRGQDSTWQYFSKGSKTGGDVYETLEQCQASLEEE